MENVGMNSGRMPEPLETLLVALILGAAHIGAPLLYKHRRFPAQQEAFGGGLAVGYVFLHLLPSLDAYHDVVGKQIYLVALLGFVTFYGLDVLFDPKGSSNKARYSAYIGAFFVYDALLVFTLGVELPSTPWLTFVFAISIAFDVLTTDMDLHAQYGKRFVKSGRWILLIGVATGYGMSLVRRPHPMVIDIITAALVGFVMYHTFNSQFPTARNKKFPAFVIGLATVSFMHFALSAAQ